MKGRPVMNCNVSFAYAYYYYFYRKSNSVL